MLRHPISLLSFVILLTGCLFKQVLFDIHPGSCINPPNMHCMEDGQDSRWLDVRIYQLKVPADPCKLDLEAFKQGQELGLLGSNLTDKDRLDAVRLVFPVQRNDPKRLTDWQILPGTKALLIVALGRGRGKNSVRQIPIEKVPRTADLYFTEYDVCIGESCEQRPQEQCP
jgi:hypothetical protein